MHQSDLYLPVPPVTSRFAPPVRLPASASTTSAWPQSISNSTNPKKRNVERACDGCRRRKTRCDGPKMPDNVCTNCVQNRKICTYVLAQTFVKICFITDCLVRSEASKPRGPSKAFVMLDRFPVPSVQLTYFEQLHHQFRGQSGEDGGIVETRAYVVRLGLEHPNLQIPAYGQCWGA